MAVASTTLDLGLYADIQRYGAANVAACFSCGTCTAVCPLVEGDSTFPRRIIRYAQLGMKDALLSSKELWTCYACGECSESCPMQAEPSEFMAATRRYAIAHYDRTGLARLMYMPFIGTAVAVVLAVFFALFMYSFHGPMSNVSLDIFSFVPEDLIHNTGVVLMIAVFLAGLVGLLTMARGIARQMDIDRHALLGSRAALWRAARSAWSALAVETLGQRRYRTDCDKESAYPWYRRRWFIHAATMWGFLGLLAATALDYGLAVVGIKATGTPVPIWYPIRLLGTLAGLALVYGTTMLIWRRARRAERSLRNSTTADWTFLALLEIAGLTGFGLELALYLPQPPEWGYWMFLFHVAVAMELVLLAPFMKFAHAIYRPLALFFLALAGEPLPVQAPAAKEALP
jgi:ferredoxin